MLGGFTYQALTDAKGFYSFDMVTDSGTYELRTLSHAYLQPRDEDARPLQVALGPQSRAVKHLQLEPGCQVDVLVVDPEGRPLRDVRLIGSWMGSDRANDVGFPAITDKDGRATMGAFPPSDVAYQVTAIHPNYALQQAPIKCSDLAVPGYVQMELNPGMQVAGTVVYSNGVPAKGVRIVAQPNWWHNQTPIPGALVDAHGAFVLSGIAPGSYSVLAFMGGEQRLYSRQVTQAKLPLADQEIFELVIPGAPPQMEAAIRGHLAFSTTVRPEVVYVMAYSRAGSFVPRQPLNPQVRSFSLNGLPPGEYTLVFDGSQIRERVIEAVRAPTDGLEVALDVVATPVIKGVVLGGREGIPVDDFQVGIMKQRKLPGLLFRSETTWHSVADGGGRFEIPSEGPGLYQVQVVAKGYVPAQLEAVNTDDPHPAVFDLRVGGRVEGRVLSRGRQAIVEALP